jgi:predicted PurR-regulated permease PerM
MTSVGFRRGFLILLVALITIAFLWMIRIFLLTIILAALFTGVAYPIHRRLTQWFGGRERIAAVTTLLLLVLLVIGPLLGVAGAVANEAARVNETILPKLQELIAQPSLFDEWLAGVPGYERIAPYREEILKRAGQMIEGAGAFILNALRATAMSTVVFIFHFVVMLYTMYFFFLDGPQMVRAMLGYLPLADSDKQHMLEQFVSVTRATLKGTVLIGLAQGVLGGFAFWMVGISGAVFWGTVMTVLSIIPGIGGALVWVPAAIILLAMGNVWQAIVLAAFSALVVGSVDNLLRPILVGRDTKMHELMIFFSTLSGLLLFGAMGFIIGPILAALFLTIWDIFRGMFRRELADSISDVIVTPEQARVDTPEPARVIRLEE